MLHIATITFDWYPFEPRALRLAEAAIEAGHEVDIICPRRHNEPEHASHHGVHIHRVPMQRHYGCSLPRTLLSWCRFLFQSSLALCKLHRQRRYDIILVHNMPDFLVFAAWLPKLQGVKVILDVQDASPELMAEKARGSFKHLVLFLAACQERLSTAFADHVVTVGWTVEELLLNRGVPREKLTSILNSADPGLFPPALPAQIDERGSTSFKLIYYGTVAERQGLDVAIRALVQVKRAIPHVQLAIKGVGEQVPALQRLAHELGISDAVEFSPFCPVEEVAQFIESGDVGIIPYRGGGYMEIVLPTKAFELAQMGCPMIASNLRGIRSLFRAESLSLCEPANPNALAQCIIDLYFNPGKCIRLVRNAAQDYQQYRWEQMTQRYQQMLQSVHQSSARKQAVNDESEQPREEIYARYNSGDTLTTQNNKY